ncbi:MAG: FtsX-like permease family protein, partial [Bryobacteraceae bacterium]
GQPPQPEVFISGAQLPDSRMAGIAVAWVIRTHTRSRQFDTAILNELRQGTGEPVPPLRSMDEVVIRSTALHSFYMLLMSVFGGSALLLAAVGIYGLLVYLVQQRAREIGIRMALGAGARNVRNIVVAEGMRLACAGVAIGILAALGLTRFLAGFLFGVKALDPVVFLVVPVLLSSAALIAVWMPARRASRVDPIQALRHE